MNRKPSATHPQSTAPERHNWQGWMNGATWHALSRCQPWPTPLRVARAYRELYGRPPEVGPPGRSFQYSEAEILAVAAYLLERQQQAEAAQGCRLRRGVGR